MVVIVYSYEYTGNYDDVEVTEEIYNTYRRSYWNEEKNNKKEHKCTVPLSLITYLGSGEEERYIDSVLTDNNTVEKILETEDLREVLWNAINQLNNIPRRRFILMYVEKYTAAKIAAMEGVSRGTVLSSVDNAKKKLRKILEKTIIDF